MLKIKVSKNLPVINSILNRLQRKKAYFNALEADFIQLLLENKMLKRKIHG